MATIKLSEQTDLHALETLIKEAYAKGFRVVHRPDVKNNVVQFRSNK